jgi:hypothetical protein
LPTIGEHEDHAARIYSEVRRFAGQVQRVFTDRVEERAVQIGSQRDDRGGCRRHVDAPQHVTARAPNLDLLGVRAARHRIAHSKLAERRQRVRREQKAEAQLPRACGAFEDPHLPADPPQRNAGREATDPCADDQRRW